MTTDFATFIASSIKSHPAEATIVRKVFKALKEAGKPVTSVWDGEENTKVTSLQETMELVFNLDEAFLKTSDGSWVRIILGNEWDALSDYTVNLEDALASVNSYIDTKG
ncbi:hypothetical protein [Microbacterium sp. KR10-403]|uniref:hypothetical protein n=1 Tax=Microbacterium sp. KR10-403 TaxID=3158581 RepID=UPI0032E3F0C3